MSTAAPRPSRPSWWWWLLPIGVVLTVLALWRAEHDEGETIVVRFPDAHGLTVGDPLRHRGMDVGRVVDLRLVAEEGVDCRLALQAEAAHLARRGSVFWIERPMLGVDGVSGLETVVSGRHVGVRPGTGPALRRFTGLAAPPLDDLQGRDGIEVVLQAPERGGLQPGAPVRFRGFTVGQVLDVALARDASAVEIRILVRAAHVGLLRPGSRFWRARGLRIEAGLFDGFNVEVASLPTLIRGGIAFATPPGDEIPVLGGHRYRLHEAAEPDWLRWRPSLLGDPGGLGERLPVTSRATLSWEQGSWWRSEHSRRAWVVALPEGWLGLRAIIEPPSTATADSVRFAIDGEARSLAELRTTRHLALLPLAEPPAAAAGIGRRAPSGIEDVVVVAQPGRTRLVAAARLAEAEGVWRVDGELVFGADWHGAPVLAEADGALIGLLAVRDDGVVVVPLDLGVFDAAGQE